MKLPRSFYSWTTFIGGAIAGISLLVIIFLVILSLLFDFGDEYSGLIMWIIMPVFLVIGLIMIPIGIITKRRRERREKVVRHVKFPIFDFNVKEQRTAFFIFGIGTIIFLMLTAVGSYEAFHYTESVEFCGTLCHKVMEPEYVAYQNSAHARVACVECHVGTGANWYVRSKLSGLYQVYAVLTNNYPQPIETPIENLRPARETCEECHWPEQFYARQLVVERHYLADQDNTEWDISLQMKTGPMLSALGLQEGIHWHINPDVKVEYIATDDKRLNIPWVRLTDNATGEMVVFQDEYDPIAPEMLDSMEVRLMDCMDCHTRPSHDYKNPIKFVNDAISAGSIPRDLPDIKMLAMGILNNHEFSTKDSALMYIESEVLSYYESSYEEIFRDNRPMIEQAIAGIQDGFQKNIFPYMKVSWKEYPNHIGHMEFNGCFRCHNDRHNDGNGRVISKDCNLCHSIVAQGTPDTLQITDVYGALEFVAPNDPDGAWKEFLCNDCHSALY